MIRLESRHLKRRWLTKWWPGNQYAMVLHSDELDWDEACEAAEFAIGHGAFAATVEDGDRIAAYGAVKLHGALE